VVELRDGPELIFGSAHRVRAKWIAATRVLADPESAGATYIDVTLPGRPAAGGLAAETLSPVAPAGTEGASPDAATPPAATVDPATEQLAPAAPTTPDPAATDPATTPAPPAEPAPAPPETAGGGASPAPAE
jgi:cell division protein FtsQ